MYAINALLPSSKIKKWENRCHPDENGGFEFGTWYLYKWAPETIVNQFIDIQNVDNKGYTIHHPFTKNDCKIMLEFLSTWKKEKKNGRINYVSPLYEYDNDCFKTNFTVYGFKKFKQVFSNMNDLPVYYSM